MDRRVKERLVGASILVVLIVLIVPALLSGPKPMPAMTRPPLTSNPEPVRTVTVDLATSQAPSGETAAEDAPSVATPGVATPGVDTPSVAAGTPMMATGAAGSGNTAVAAQDTPPSRPLESPVTSPTSKPSAMPAHAAWAVQLGSFATRSNAEKLTHQLKAQGFAVYVLSSGAGSAARYRVRVGPAADRGAAAETAAKLRSLGHPSSIVAP